MSSRSLALLLLYFTLENVFASEKDVLDHIFQGYDSRIRPIKNTSLPVVVWAGTTIIRLIEVYWNDEFLVWNPVDFNGTEYVTVPADTIWKPDTIITTTSFENEEFIDKDRELVRLYSNGGASYSTPFVLSNYCPMKADEFPYDQQNCTIKMTSWRYLKKEIIFELYSSEQAPIQNEHTEWHVTNITGITFDLIFPDAEYRQLHFTLTIKRKPAYYVSVLIMPTLIITVLSIAGIFAPLNNLGDRQEKITLGLTTLLTLAVILSMVTGEMPRATNLPLLGQFVLVEITIIVICMAISVVILFLHQRTTTRSGRVPCWLAKIVFLHGNKVKNEPDTVIQSSRLPSTLVLYGKQNDIKHRDMPDELKKTEKCEHLDGSAKLLDDAIARVNNYIQKNERKIMAEEEEEQRKHEWLILFDRLDLLLFVGFQVAHAALYLTLFMR